jgi:uncharacterized protein (UPF0335 family)
MDGNTHIDTALRGYVDRIVRLHEDRDYTNGEIRVVYGEAKESGFNVTVLRGMVKEYRMDVDARNALYQQQEDYRIALGMLAGTPLGDAAERRETAEWPTPFAEQPVHEPKRPRRGRPRKEPTELWSRQADETVGTA